MEHKFDLIGSIRNALRGIIVTVKTQRNARIHLLATIIVIAVGFAFQVSRGDWLWLIAAIAAVWITELLNTAIEQLTDLASPQWHPLARDAKDIAAGAVLVSAIAAWVVGVVVLAPYIAAHV